MIGARVDNSTWMPTKWRLIWGLRNHAVTTDTLAGADLTQADLSGADLRGIDLSGANLRAVDLRKAGLRQAKLMC
jgi:uncharacterized protein YjbI with pentapeptide repeats